MPRKRKKKMRQEKRKKKGGEKAKSKSQDCLDILLSAHARTSKANILHLDQKAAKCMTCKPVCGKFYLFIARQWPENHSTSFKTRFSAKSPGANGLIKRYFCNHSLPLVWAIRAWIVTLVSYQGCALAEPGGPWCLTFALRQIENLSFLIQVICRAP